MAIANRELSEIQREARLVGLRRDAPTIESVERRRLQLHALTLGMLAALTAAAVLASIWTGLAEAPQWISPHLLRSILVTLSLAFGLYAAEKEVHLKRLTTLLAEEQGRITDLEGRLHEVTALLDAGKALNAELELGAVLDIILRSALGLMGGDAGSVFLVQHGEHLQRVSHRAGSVASTDDHHVAAEVVRSRTPRLTESSLAVPLVHRDLLVGVLHVASSPGAPLGALAVGTAKLFAEHAASAIANARLFERERVNSQELAFRASHDALTHLPNRALFVDHVKALVGAGRRDFAVVFLDIDNFKTVNDSVGHVAGDTLLMAVAERLQRSTETGDLCARFGGDEFAIALHELPDAATSVPRTTQILAALEAPFTIASRQIYVSATAGIATAAAGAVGVTELLRNADVAMYAAKRAGKSRVELFRPEMHQAVVERLQLEAELQRALARHELVVHYQPTIELRTGRAVGLEALVRWQHPERGLLLPQEFIPVAEELGLILDLGSQVLREACTRAAEWRHLAGPEPLTMHINLSAHQLHQPDIVDEVAGVLAETGADPSQIVLEITESVVMHESDLLVERLERLRALGVKVAIDDFGTGYSSLSYLHRFPVDVLKIDKLFTHGVGGSAGEAALAQAIVRLARTLHLRTVAEGVEKPRQLQGLRDMGCHFAQGHLFARAAPAAKVPELLARHYDVSCDAPVEGTARLTVS
jgi:diguanylate cyclase (GGDEF)-like protein